MDLFHDRAAALPELDHRGRVAALQQAVAGLDVDVTVISKLVNVRYLCGFTGSHALLVVGRHGALTLVTDGRYRDQAAQQLAEAGVDAALRVETAKFDEAVAEVIRESAGLGGEPIRLGLEADGVSWAEQRRYAEQFPDAHLEALSGLVEALRACKEPGEIARMELAAHIADQALADVIGSLHRQPTEREFAVELEVAMRRLGADGPSFETIVASGPNGALPHARPGPRRIERGDLVVLDFGALVAGYHSDMTRTV
ncbi:MAG: M24 family metallopeptidase, partial [Acidimicrobiales bacterium]